MIGNVRFKAQGEAGKQPSTAEALELKNKISEALKQIEEAMKYDQYYEMGEKAELAKSKALLEADLAALDYFLKTGEWIGPTLPSDSNTPAQQLFDLSTVGLGWYVYDQAGRLKKVEVTEDGEIFVENNAVPDGKGGVVPAKLWFVATDDVESITGRNIDDDIEVRITYKDGRPDDVYVIKNGATRTDIRIGINALKSDSGVRIDFSRVMIMNPKTGEKGGVFIIGSKGDDQIYGSAGRDEIHGAGGADLIEGFGGADDIFGYASSVDRNGDGVKDGVLDFYGAEALGADGDDTIYDIFGTDIIDAGPGAQDIVYRGKTSESISPAAGEEMGEPQTGPIGDDGVVDSWFDSQNWTMEVSTDNEHVMTKKPGVGSETEIELTLPEGEGWMLSAEADTGTNSKDLIITAVKIDENTGEPVYYRIRIKNYFGEDNKNLKLKITNSFIDMSNVRPDEGGIGTRSVELTGTSGSGDILVGPKTILDEYGIKMDNLGNATADDSWIRDQLKGYVNDTDKPWAKADPKSGVITLNADDSMLKDGLDIPASLGDVAFVERNGKDLTITIVSNEGKQAKIVVIKIKNAPAGYESKIKLGGSDSKVHYLGGSKPGVAINGLEGADFTAGYQFGVSFDDVDDKGLEITYKPSDHPPGQGSPTTKDGLISKINSASGDNAFTLLDNYEAKIKTWQNESEKAELQKALNDKRAELIAKWTSDLKGLYTDYLSETDPAKQAEKKKKLQDKINTLDAQIKKLEAISYNGIANLRTDFANAIKDMVKNPDSDLTLK